MSEKRFFFYNCILGFVAIFFLSCSNTKKKGVSQTLTNFTSYYNAYFNAKWNYKLALKDIKKNKLEYFENTYPIFEYEDNIDDFKSHSKLSQITNKVSKIYTKKSGSKWLDDALLLNGKQYYLKGNYDTAITQFEYIVSKIPQGFKNEIAIKNKPKRYFKALKKAKKNKEHVGKLSFFHDFAKSEAIVWLAKSYIKNKMYTEANILIKSAYDDISFQKEFLNDLKKAEVLLYIEKKEFLPAIDIISELLDDKENIDNIDRLQIIKAQLNENIEKSNVAIGLYNKIILSNSQKKFKTESIIRLAALSSKSNANKNISELKKLLTNSENEDIKSKIYYFIAKCFLINNKKEDAIINFTKATQEPKTSLYKFLAFENMSKLYFYDKKYNSASLNCDSANLYIPTNYSDKENFEKYHKPLSSLSKLFNDFSLSDSLLNLTKIPKNELRKKLIKERKKEANTISNIEALNKINNSIENTINTTKKPNSKFYFYNDNSLKKGRLEFEKTWGKIKLQPNWKFSATQNFSNVENAKIENDEILDKNDAISNIIDLEISKLPYSEVAKNIEIEKAQLALFEIGKIFYSEINDYETAILYFLKSLELYDYENKNEEELLYYLHLSYKQINDIKNSESYKKLMKNLYPNSKLLNVSPSKNIEFTSNPILDEQYKEAYNFFEKNKYSVSMNILDDMIDNSNSENHISKALLLKAMILSKNNNLKLYIETLKNIISKYPKSNEYIYANELYNKVKDLKIETIDSISSQSTNQINVSDNSKSLLFEAPKDSITSINKESQIVNFKFSENEPHQILIELAEQSNVYIIKRELENYLYTKYPNISLKINIEVISNKYFISIRYFDKILIAKSIITLFENDPKLIKFKDEVEYVLISNSNLTLLKISNSWSSYLKFYKDFY